MKTPGEIAWLTFKHHGRQLATPEQYQAMDKFERGYWEAAASAIIELCCEAQCRECRRKTPVRYDSDLKHWYHDLPGGGGELGCSSSTLRSLKVEG